MRIKKTSQTTPTTAQVVNTQSNSTQDSYSCDYVNNNVGKEVYSTTEQVIGTWIDGKPLYRKTYNLGSLPNNAQKNIALNIDSLNKITSFTGVMQDTTSCSTLPYVSSVASASVDMWINNNNIVLQTHIDRTSFSGFAEICYTKTTD